VRSTSAPGVSGIREKRSPDLRAPRPPRLREVAEEAGVSVTTVSVVLSGAPNSVIPIATQERVRSAAQRLGYVPNFSAQFLRTKRSRTLGFITDGIATSPFAGEMIAGAQSAAWKRDYVLLIVDAGELQELAESAARVLLSRHVERVIVASWYHRAVNVPVSLHGHTRVLANCFAKAGDYTTIVPDEVGGGYVATRRLLERQRGPVGFISLRKDRPAGPGRLKGYKRALREAGVPYDSSLVLTTRTGQAREGFELTARLLDERPDIRLLFCGNDRTAMGAFEAIKLRGLGIPQDIAVVGFDNQEIIADELVPALTTVALPHYEMGERAVERALEPLPQVPAQAPPPETELAPCVLVERQSV
jgi:LacI family transcriptional regulator